MLFECERDDDLRNTFFQCGSEVRCANPGNGPPYCGRENRTFLEMRIGELMRTIMPKRTKDLDLGNFMHR